MQETMRQRIARAIAEAMFVSEHVGPHEALVRFDYFPTEAGLKVADAGLKELRRPTDWMLMQGQKFSVLGFHEAYDAMIRAALTEDERKAEGKL